MLHYLKGLSYTSINTKTQTANKLIGGIKMARSSQPQDDLLMGDDITAAFLSEDEAPAEESNQTPEPVMEDEGWDEDQPVAGQLAVDVYETKEKLVVKGRVAGVNKSDLDVS